MLRNDSRVLASTACGLALLALAACGGAEKPAAQSPSTRPAPVAGSESNGPVARPASNGSSDGVSCEEAQEQNVEEVAIGEKSAPDLTVKQLGAVLNNGAFMQPCNVPDNAKISVCAAVKNGAVVGVTVAVDPADQEMEKCLATQVRGLSFPVHPKMDIVRTSF